MKRSRLVKLRAPMVSNNKELFQELINSALAINYSLALCCIDASRSSDCKTRNCMNSSSTSNASVIRENICLLLLSLVLLQISLLLLLLLFLLITCTTFIILRLVLTTIPTFINWTALTNSYYS